MPRRTAVLGAPSAIGISPYRDGGPRRLDLSPRALRELGLVDRLGATDCGDVDPNAAYGDLERPSGRIRNEEEVAAYSLRLGDRIAALAARGDFIVLLGGDCSILLGSLVGLLRQGPDIGLVYIDGHADFASLGESPSGSACSMNLALAAGRSADGPLARLGGDTPLVEPSRVAHVGRRDEDDPAYGNEALSSSAIADFPARRFRGSGREAVAGEVLAQVSAAQAGFWIHLDVDVLDPILMPAVDSPLPDGLSRDELVDLTRPLARHPAALGMQVTIYDPTLDADGRGARLIVDLLADILSAPE